jgi:hypothetical protein
MDESYRRSIALRAGFAGAMGGLALACCDFAASVLWLSGGLDRVLLGLRLAGVLIPLGVLAASGIVLLDRAVRPLIVRSRKVSLRTIAPFPLLLLLSPAVVVFAATLFEGRRAAALSPRALFVALTAFALLSLVYGALRLVRQQARTRRMRWLRALLLVGASLAISKIDQSYYPRSYPAIHAALSVFAFATAALAGFLIAPRFRALPRRSPALLALALLLALGTLPSDHDGRAALLSPRASHARSIMLGVSPLLFAWRRTASADAIDRAREAERARRRALESGELPRWEGAHVVLVTIDALRADHLGAYGYERGISPALDREMADAVLFDRAWTPTPRSSYALTSLMTGAAIHARLERGAPLPERTLASILRERGYHTAAFYPDGIFFHQGERVDGYRASELGFERRDAENHDAESLTDALLAEIDDLRARGEPPMFLWAHYFDVHEPYEERALGDSPIDRYDGEIRNVDRAFARFLEGLSSLSREVILVVSADHGEEHGDHGGFFHGASLYEEQLRVPLSIRAPGLRPRCIAAPVSLVDLAPTLSAMIGARETFEGVDLRAILIGRERDRGPVRASEDGMRAILRWPHKLIESEVGSIELFDLSIDPFESASLADDRSELVDELSDALAAE